VVRIHPTYKSSDTFVDERTDFSGAEPVCAVGEAEPRNTFICFKVCKNQIHLTKATDGIVPLAGIRPVNPSLAVEAPDR